MSVKALAVLLPQLLLLLPVVSAQIPPDILRDEATREMLFYDITTQYSSPHVIKQTFKDTAVLFMYQVIGVPRYLVLVEDDRSNALLNLKLPRDATVNRAWPVQDLRDYFAYVGYNWTVPIVIPAPSEDLVFAERVWDTAGLTLAQKKASMVGIADRADDLATPMLMFAGFGFVPVGFHPDRFLFIWSGSINGLGRLFQATVDNYGGPGKVNISILRIRAI